MIENNSRVKIGQVAFSENHIAVEFSVDDTDINAALLPSDVDANYVVGVEESVTAEGDRQRRYLKLHKQITEAGRTAIEYYHDHDSLVKGIGVISAVAGIVAVGSLAIQRIKSPRS